MGSLRIVTVLILVSLAAGCAQERKVVATAQSAGNAARLEMTVEEFPSPAGAGTAEPFLFSTSDGVLLSWLEPVPDTDRTALRFARYRANRWSPAGTIIERNDLFVNWADFPSIVEDSRGTLFAHWLQKSGEGTYSYDVRMAASSDGGENWSESFLLNRDGKEAEHGFVTLVPLPDGGVGATWLDGRKMTMSGGDHEGHDAGDMGIRYASVDANGKITDEIELDGRTCECCTTGMTMTTSGPIIVYRDRSADEVRDISYVTRTAQGWTEAAAVNADHWKINACPVNGPQIDAIGQRAVTAWFTAAEDKARALIAFSDDGGVTFAPPVQIDDGKPIGRLDVLLLDEQTALVTWLEQTARGGEIRARRVTRQGTKSEAMKIADSTTARAAGFARTARVGRHVYFAWTEQTPDSRRVRVARGRV